MAVKTSKTNDIPAMPGRWGGGPGGRGGPADRFMPREKAKNTAQTLGRLFRFYIKEGRSLFIVAGLLILLTGIGIIVPLFIGRAVDAMTGSVNIGLARMFALALAGAYAVSMVVDVSQGMLMNSATSHIVRALRKSLFDKLQTLPLVYHDANTHGELMSRITNDVDNISMTIAQSTTQLVSVIITLAGSLTVMLLLNVWMTLAALVTVPFVFLITRFIASRSRKLFAQQQKELGRLNGIIEETISGQKMVKAFNMESAVTENFACINERFKKASTGANIYSGMLMPLMHVITNIGYLTVAITGGALVAADMVSVGVIATFIIYQRQFTYPLNNLAGTFTMLQSALAGAERVFELMDEADEPEDTADAVEMTAPKGEVSFKDVSFSYTPGVPVLHNISFDVPAGATVALVGETGAGKTTVVNLLTRFYDVSGGAVYIDGIPVNKYKRDSLRRAFSVVLQDTCLFTGTIADNIRYGRPEATLDEVIAAAKAGGAHEFIIRLQAGYDTIVSGGSESLSQGQRQLLAISRAVLCSAPILILDEATSSVDTRTELRIQAAMLELARGSTSFVIAHRLSTIRGADLILVMDSGRIVERGTHDELLSRGGLYAKMSSLTK